MAKREIDGAGILASDLGFVGPTKTNPVGIPAAIVGTSLKGPAFVPITLGSLVDFYDKFGIANVSGSNTSLAECLTTYGPLAAREWFRNSSALTFVRIMGVGDGKRRIQSGVNAGEVTNAGFTVGEQQPNHVSLSGALGTNPYANSGGSLGRTYFLGCFMSESAGSNIFSSAGLQGTGSVNGIQGATAVPIIRGILMAPSGVIIRLSSSGGGLDSSSPISTMVASDLNAKGTSLGSIKLFDSNGASLQQFVLLLNGHVGTADHPNVITASFDIQSPNYITRALNLSASLLQQSGHYLASYWDIHPATATVTGSGVVTAGCDNPDGTNQAVGLERSVFILTSSMPRDTGSSIVPNYEAFRDRFSHSSTPWFVSQKFHNRYINLFKFHSLDAGTNVSNKYKFLIHDIIPSGIDDEYQHGSFSISIKQMNQLDDSFDPIESYVDVNLDPSSKRYISKVIGDIHAYYDFDRLEGEQRFVVEGNYELKSRIVRVEVSQEVHNAEIPPQSLPLGFRGISHLVTSGSSPLAPLGSTDTPALTISNFLRNVVTPPVPLTDNIRFSNNAASTRKWGIKFDHTTDLNDQNTNVLFNKSLEAFTSYFPNSSTTNINFSVSDKVGNPDTAQLGIIDTDRFCNNFFTLENIKIVTGSNGFVDPPENWRLAAYVRNGVISINDQEKTRRISVNDLRDNSSRNYLSFYTIMQGGFDGINIFDVEEKNITNAAITSDMNFANRGRQSGPNVCSYLKALEVLNNTSGFDMQILAIPGIRHPIITDEATNIAEQRFDTLYIMDIEQVNQSNELIEISKFIPYNGDQRPSVNNTVNLFSSRGLNSSFAAAYFPDVILRLPTTDYNIDRVEVPPSVVVLGAMSLNDSLGYPWFAPAGPSRGSLVTTLTTTVDIKEQDINNLYKNNINPLYKPTNASNTTSGVVIWGQKTLQKSNAILSRINNRRLLLEIRRQARDVALQLLFNQDLNSTLNLFSTQMNSRLSTIKSLFGLNDYNVIVDASTTTKSDIENNTIRGKIYLRPTKTKEFLSLDFIVSNGLESEI